MADAMTLIKVPDEKMKDFNKRLRACCHEQDVTDVQLIVVDGQPVVTLFSEVVEATQEDVEEAKEAGESLKVGDPIPENPPITAQVARVVCGSDEEIGASHKHLEILYQRANGNVVKQLHATGPLFGWAESPDKKAHAWVEKSVAYVLVAYEEPEEAEGDEEGENQEPPK